MSGEVSQRRLAPESLVLYASVFIMGGCGLAYEYTLSKLASDLLGNSIEQWALVIGVMMFFMGVGSDLQKYLNDEDLLAKFISAEIALGLCGAFAPIIILDTYGRFESHFILVQYFFIASIGLLIGFEIPLLTRINAGYRNELRFNVGNMLKMDYIGALCGALLWVFVLPRFFTTTEMAFVLGAITLAAALVALWFFGTRVRGWRTLLASNLVALSMVAGGFLIAPRWTAHAEQALYRDRIVFSQTSKYQHVVVTESRSGGVSMFINGHLQFDSQDEFIYHENLVHPVMEIAPGRSRVLVLGGGDGLAAREVLKYSDVAELVLCDIDPAVIQMAKSQPELRRINRDAFADSRLHIVDNGALLPSDTRELHVPNQNALSTRASAKVAEVRVVNLDAIRFLEQIDGRFDVAILDFPDPNAPTLAKLYSKGFYELLRQRLSPGGLIVQQSTSPFYAKEAFLTIGRTMESAGFAATPYHDNVPSMGEWGWWIAGDKRWHTKESIAAQMGSLELTGTQTRYLTPETSRASLVFGAGQLQSESTAINTLTSGVVYSQYMRGWERYF